MNARDRTLTLQQVLALTGCARAQFDALYRDGDFPRGVPLGPWATGWSEREVREWLSRRRR